VLKNAINAKTNSRVCLLLLLLLSLIAHSSGLEIRPARARVAVPPLINPPRKSLPQLIVASRF
jgi:hypothetical protein